METNKPELHKFAELDFSNIAACKLGDILNLFNQRLARIEDMTFMRDGTGHILTNENGEPLTLTAQYLKEAEEEFEKQQKAEAAATNPTPEVK
jgi:hypothetical protein